MLHTAYYISILKTNTCEMVHQLELVYILVNKYGVFPQLWALLALWTKINSLQIHFRLSNLSTNNVQLFLNNKCNLHHTMLVNTIHYMRCGRNRTTFHILFHVLHNCGIFSHFTHHVSDFISNMLFNDTVVYMVTKYTNLTKKTSRHNCGLWQKQLQSWRMVNVCIYQSWLFMNFF